MARYEHLPIYKAAFDLNVYMEKIVRGFSRYHKSWRSITRLKAEVYLCVARRQAPSRALGDLVCRL